MKKVRTFLWSAALLTVLTPRSFSWAQTGTVTPPPSSGGGGQIITLDNPFKKGGNSLYDFIKTVITDIILPLGGVIVVVMLIYSGFLFVTARGNTSQLTKARQNFLYVVIGTAVLLGSWVIATVIENTINQLKG